MSGKFLFLGTGGSMGIPVIGCPCKVCQSNTRMRPSALVKIDDKHLLIDVGPDFRTQALRFGLKKLDGVLLTHTHFDHIAGVDDLRIFTFLQKSAIPCLLSDDAKKDLETRYYYLFEKDSKAAKLNCHILDQDYGEAVFCDVRLRYLTYWQAGMKVTGFRFGDLAYVTDIQRYDPEVLRQLHGVKTLVLSALRYDESPVHFNIPEAIAFAKKVQAEKTYFTHIAHEIDHQETSLALPSGVELGYDGLELEFNGY